MLSVVIVTNRGGIMLLDPSPKRRREDLFDRDQEFKRLESLIFPMALVLGARRIVKTSLVRVFSNESCSPVAFIDCRRFSFAESKLEDFIGELVRSLRKLEKFKKIFNDLFGRMEELEMFNVRFKMSVSLWRKSIVDILEKINEWAGKRDDVFCFVFDEAQNLRYFQIILTGSEVGVLKDFLEIETGSSPLFGRYVKGSRRSE